MTETPETVLDFWFSELTPEDWFRKSDETDRTITDRFKDLHLALSREIPGEWRASPDARLALIIVLDQFPRNIYRGSPLAFATDGLALKEAKAALAVGADKAAFLGQWERVNRLVHDLVFEMNGSFSAEHGIGQLKRDELRHYKPAVALDMMRALKATLDPNNIMNPGKVL